MSQIYKAFAVVGNDPDALSVASTDGVQLAVYANEPSAVEALRQDGEAAVKVVMMTQGTYDALQGMISAAPVHAEADVEALKADAERLRKQVEEGLPRLMQQCHDLRAECDTLKAENEGLRTRVAPARLVIEIEPTAWQAGFIGHDWSTCSKEHHDMVKQNPAEWPEYQVRALYAESDVEALKAENQRYRALLERALSWELSYHLSADIARELDLQTPVPSTKLGERFRLAEAEAERLTTELEGAQNLVRFLAKLYCDLDGLRYETMKRAEGEVFDFMMNSWPVVQGTANQIRLMRLSEMPYDSSKLAAAVEAALAAKTEVAAGPEAAPVNQVDGL